MGIVVRPSGQACGATVTGVDLTALDAPTVAEIRVAWLQHHVLAFPDQPLSDEQLERFSLW
ncbi:MAG: TauD/TfdA family dioxygenase, partial [Ilumatobacteraceae bacterium]